MMAGAMDDSKRFERLWAEHHEAVWAYAARRVGADRAPDVVHETFLVAWRRLDDVPAAAAPWLLGVARNVLLHERRGAARRARLDERLAGVLPPPPEPTGADGELLAAARRLPQADRELLALLAWDGLTIAEAATVLGWRPVTARVRLHRARRRLESLLADDASAPPIHRPAREGAP